ncbi:hypothetical protein D3Y55_27250 [Mesorhizobium sp. DCY119]|nr:hypothetical protein D3Y55_27250 [Mesorhizobium sp. DCY119]
MHLVCFVIVFWDCPGDTLYEDRQAERHRLSAAEAACCVRQPQVRASADAPVAGLHAALRGREGPARGCLPALKELSHVVHRGTGGPSRA